MPILLWIAFWSNLTGLLACWRETALPIGAGKEDRRDHTNK